MLEDIAEKFRHKLNPDEKLIWIGQPQQGIMLRIGDVLIIPCSIVWVYFEFSSQSSVFTIGNIHPIIVLLKILVVLLCLYATVGRFFYDMLQRQKTYYALTNARAIIITELLIPRIKSIYFKKLTEINISTKANGKGIITFGPVNPIYNIFAGSGLPMRHVNTPLPYFEMIENVERVYQRIKELQREAH